MSCRSFFFRFSINNFFEEIYICGNQNAMYPLETPLLSGRPRPIVHYIILRLCVSLLLLYLYISHLTILLILQNEEDIILLVDK